MEMNSTIQIVALVALISFIVLSVFLIVSLTSVAKLARSAANSLDKIAGGLGNSLAKMTDDFSEMKLKFVTTLKNADAVIVKIEDKIDETGDINAKVDHFLDNTDKLVELAQQKSSEITEMKTKSLESLETANIAIVSITRSSEKLGYGLDSFVRLSQPLNGILSDLYNKIFMPFRQVKYFMDGFQRSYGLITNLINKFASKKQD